MALLSYPRTRETTTTTGTGNITLAGAVVNFVTLASWLSTNDYLNYVIEDGLGNWEVGIGQLTASTTLVRSFVLYSSNSNSAVSFGAGTKTVTLTLNDRDSFAVDDMLFGDGSDGDVTISSGTTTLSRDMYYKNLTISGTGKIAVQGYKVFVSEVLDISAAGVGAISFNGSDGGAASGTGAGAVGTSPFIQTVGGGGAGQVGKAGGTAAGTAGGTSSTFFPGVGGSGSGAGGAGGSGSGGAGGAAGGIGSLTLYAARRRFSNLFFHTAGLNQLRGGIGGGSGGSGGGDGTAGGGSGASGGGGGHLFIAARIINRSGSTVAGAIQSHGGLGGNGGNPAGGNRGGGGGGGGGCGGWIQLFYLHLIGSTATNALQSKGGDGGTGGTKTGTGVNGGGGVGGSSGYITVNDLGTNSSSEAVPSSSGTAASGTTGGVGATTQVSL